MNLIQKLLRRAEVDRAVIYGILTNVSNLSSGFIALILIATYFPPVLQGFYYTFSSILAMRYLAELSLGNVIINFASHEWSKLDLDGQGRIIGESESLSRLVSLGQFVFLWYLIAGGIVAIGLGFGGYIFFLKSSYPGVNWVVPWLVLCALAGINFWFLPAFFLLEGCNQVFFVYGLRLGQSILSGLSICMAILLGASLWVPALSVAISITWSVVFIAWRHRQFFSPFFRRIVGPRISWRFEIWPMQWRIGISSLGGTLASFLFTPVLFHYHGAVVAGQIGMTLTLIGAVQGISNLWVATKTPQFGMLIAENNYEVLDRQFFRVFVASMSVLALGSIGVWLIDYLLYTFHHRLSTRLLSPLPTGIFILGQMAMYSTSPLAIYLRAHKKEPFLGLSLISGALIGLSVWFLGSRYAALGAAVGYLLVTSLFTLPYGIFTWWRCRSSWHSGAD